MLLERYLEEGQGKSTIARKLGISRYTISRWEWIRESGDRVAQPQIRVRA